MGRPRTYDPEQVLDAARDAFWRRGYEGTSVSELCRATGLEKGSLYHAFGDKKGLFLQVLERYLEGGRAYLQNARDEADDAVEAIRGWLCRVTGGCVVDEERRGCLATNSVIELAPHDPKVRALLARHFDRVGGELAELVREGQARGEIRSDRDAEDLVGYLLTFTSGFSANARGGPIDAAAVIDLVVDGLRPR